MSALETRVLALLEDVIGLTDLDEFRGGLLEALRRAIPSDVVSLNDLGPGPMDAITVAIPSPFPTDTIEAFARYKHQNPIAQYHARTRDGRAYRFSDLINRRELRRLPLYQHVYARLGIHYQIAFTLPSEPNRLLGVALSRRERNYTSGERDLINRARPVLIQAFRNAVEQHQLKTTLTRLIDGCAIIDPLIEIGLTEREARVLGEVAHGRSTRDIAAGLDISPRTVGKHLERCFRKLNVTTQSAAAAKAWKLATGGHTRERR